MAETLAVSFRRNAVKKFVYENQGLVRRMYGDMRHIFVMQSEMENEIEMEDIADKYSKAFNGHNQRQMKSKKAAERKNFRSDSEPYFRPAQRPSAINSKQKTKPPKVVSNDAQADVLLDNLIKSNVDAIVGDLKTKEDDEQARVEVSKQTTKLTSVSSSSTTPSSASNSKDEQFVSSDEAADDNDEMKVVLNLFNNISSALSSTTPSSLNTSTVDDEDKLSSTLRSEVLTSSALDKQEEEVVEETLNDLEQVASSVGETFSDTDALDRNNSKEPQTTTTETQLFQDTVQKDKDPTPIVNRRGV